MTDSSFNERYASARRSVIKNEFRHLNPSQAEGVLATEGPLLILAGAGSGKTTVLINRIANILKYGKGSDSGYVPEFAGAEELAFLENYAENPRPDYAERAASLCSVERRSRGASWQ
jgi:DNA helicase-2/ATP-dependent DNA helicase PcrA